MALQWLTMLLKLQLCMATPNFKPTKRSLIPGSQTQNGCSATQLKAWSLHITGISTLQVHALMLCMHGTASLCGTTSPQLLLAV